MKIESIRCHVLLQDDFKVGSTSSAQDDFIVEIVTDEGVVGIGETDLNPWIARAAVEAPGTHTMGLGLAEMLIGEDPMDVERLWQKLYIGSAHNGRRGAVVNAIGALDMALHDLRGKVLGRPCYELLDGAVLSKVVPYASLQPEVSSIDAYRKSLVDWAHQAKDLGFKAAKLEATFDGPYRHMGIDAPMSAAGDIIAEVRDVVGPDFVLMVDVQYAFPDVDTCLETIRDWDSLGLYFLEAPLFPDDLAGYRRLAEEQPIPIASGEWLSTRFEFNDLMDHGRAHVVQPDVGRVGGLTEAQRVCIGAAERGLSVVPHAWKTGLTIAASAHLVAANENCTFTEFLPPTLSHSPLRSEVTVEELEFTDGELVIPDRPGLGVELNHEAMERYRVGTVTIGRDG